MKIEEIRKLKPMDLYVLEILKNFSEPVSVETVASAGGFGYQIVYRALRNLVNLGFAKREWRQGKYLYKSK